MTQGVGCDVSLACQSFASECVDLIPAWSQAVSLGGTAASHLLLGCWQQLTHKHLLTTAVLAIAGILSKHTDIPTSILHCM